MIIDELRIVGSTQTNVVMIAELTRVAQRALNRRLPVVKKEGLGQLRMPWDPDLAWAAVTYMRTPTRVVRDVYRSTAGRLEPLYDELFADICNDTRGLVQDRDGISVEARRTDQFAAGERQIVGTVKNALLDGAARRNIRLHVDPDRPASRWVARVDDAHELVVSIDLGGGSLSQRGWRREAGDAPLREHLAAVLLMLARFDPRRDLLVDPMCGAGTIPIEAWHLARATPRWTQSFRDRKAEPLYPEARPVCIGCDVDLEVLQIARANARDAEADVVLQRADVTRLTPETITAIAHERGSELTTGVLLANPPYGERLGDDYLYPLYHDMAMTCRQFRGWRAGFLVGNPLLEKAFFEVIGPPKVKKPLANANLRAYFFLYEL